MPETSATGLLLCASTYRAEPEQLRKASRTDLDISCFRGPSKKVVPLGFPQKPQNRGGYWYHGYPQKKTSHPLELLCFCICALEIGSRSPGRDWLEAWGALFGHMVVFTFSLGVSGISSRSWSGLVLLG